MNAWKGRLKFRRNLFNSNFPMEHVAQKIYRPCSASVILSYTSRPALSRSFHRIVYIERVGKVQRSCPDYVLVIGRKPQLNMNVKRFVTIARARLLNQRVPPCLLASHRAPRGIFLRAAAAAIGFVPAAFRESGTAS